MNPSEVLLRELQQCCNAMSTRLLAINAAIAQVTQGPNTWRSVIREIEEARGMLDVLARRMNQTNDHLLLMIEKYNARKASIRTGVPVNEVLRYVARGMKFPN